MAYFRKEHRDAKMAEKIVIDLMDAESPQTPPQPPPRLEKKKKGKRDPKPMREIRLNRAKIEPMKIRGKCKVVSGQNR